MTTPLGIEILIHYHCTGGTDYPHESPAATECIADFISLGILKPTFDNPDRGPEYVAIREASTVYIEALCAVPLPVQRWVVLEKTA